MLLALLSAAACESLAEPEPSLARILLEGEEGEIVELVTSREFVLTRNRGEVLRVNLFSSDTLLTPLPYDGTRELAGEGRIFVEASARGDGVDAFRMRILLDDEPTFTEAGPLLAGAPFRFVYDNGELFTSTMQVR